MSAHEIFFYVLIAGLCILILVGGIAGLIWTGTRDVTDDLRWPMRVIFGSLAIIALMFVSVLGVQIQTAQDCRAMVTRAQLTGSFAP